MTGVGDRAPAERRRRRVVVWATIGLVACAGIAWVLLRQVQSPAEAALDTRPPVLPPPTAQVTQGSLDTFLRSAGHLVGVVGVQLQQEGTLTTPVDETASVAAGDMLAEVDLRPVFLFTSQDVVAVRDLVGGVSGRDVESVQTVLAELQLLSGEVDGTYGAGTAAAVEGLYETTGHDPSPPAVTSIEVTLAQAAVGDAERNLARLKRTPSSGSGEAEAVEADDVGAASIAQAEAALVASRSELARVELAALTPLPLTEYVIAADSPLSPLSSHAIGDPAEAVAFGVAAPALLVPLTIVDVATMSVGDPAVVDVDGRSVDAIVAWIAQTVGPDGLAATKLVDPGQFVGDNDVAVLIETTQAVGDDPGSLTVVFPPDNPAPQGMVVPMAAIRTDAQGRDWVAAGGTQEDASYRVDVSVLATDQVDAVVTPLAGDQLAVGDWVRLGEGR